MSAEWIFSAERPQARSLVPPRMITQSKRGERVESMLTGGLVESRRVLVGVVTLIIHISAEMAVVK